MPWAKTLREIRPALWEIRPALREIRPALREIQMMPREIRTLLREIRIMPQENRSVPWVTGSVWKMRLKSRLRLMRAEKAGMLRLFDKVPNSSRAEGVDIVRVKDCVVSVFLAPGVPLGLASGLPIRLVDELSLVMGSESFLTGGLFLRYTVDLERFKMLLHPSIEKFLGWIGFRDETGRADKISGIEPSELCRRD